jgi:hypothetical protein
MKNSLISVSPVSALKESVYLNSLLDYMGYDDEYSSLDEDTDDDSFEFDCE